MTVPSSTIPSSLLSTENPHSIEIESKGVTIRLTFDDDIQGPPRTPLIPSSFGKYNPLTNDILKGFSDSEDDPNKWLDDLFETVSGEDASCLSHH